MERIAVAVIGARNKAAEQLALALEERGMLTVSASTEHGVGAAILRHHPEVIVFDLEPTEEALIVFNFARRCGLLDGKRLVVTTDDARKLSTVLKPGERIVVFEKPFDVDDMVTAIERLMRPAGSGGSSTRSIA